MKTAWLLPGVTAAGLLFYLFKNKKKLAKLLQCGDAEPTSWSRAAPENDSQLALLTDGPLLVGKEKYLGGVLDDDGKIYGIPGHARRVLRIQPDTGKVDFIGPEFSGQYKWLRGYRCGGAIYGIPCHADCVLKIVPATGEVTTFGSLGDGLWKWHGAVVSPHDGCIYGIPQFAESVLRIDPKTDTVTTFGGPFPGRNKWYGGLLAGDGCIYGVPQNSSHVLRIDPVAQTATVHANLPDGGWKWHGGVVGCDGCVYGLPAHADTVLKIQPGVEPQVTEIGHGLKTGRHRSDGKYKYLGGVVGQDGCIYGIPSDSDQVLQINPLTQTVKQVGATLENETWVQNKWQNGFLAPDGAIYGIPLKADSVLCVRPGRGPGGEPEVTTLKGCNLDGFNKWEGGVLGADGCMYCMPLNAKRVMRVSPRPCAGYPAPAPVKPQGAQQQPQAPLAAAPCVAVLRSTAHKTAYSKKRKSAPPPDVTLSFSARLRQQAELAFDPSIYDLRGCVVSLLGLPEAAAVGRFPVHREEGHGRLESFRVEDWAMSDKDAVRLAEATLAQLVSGDESLLVCYDKLMLEVVLPAFKRMLVEGRGDESMPIAAQEQVTFFYQRPPTLRLQPGPSERTVRAHSDSEYGHQDGELNFWMPLTDVEQTRTTLWVETAPAAGDFKPLQINLGSIAAFHGTSCRHHVPQNPSGCTRVSLDFRVGVEGYFDPRWSMRGTKQEHTRAQVTF